MTGASAFSGGLHPGESDLSDRGKTRANKWQELWHGSGPRPFVFLSHLQVLPEVGEGEVEEAGSEIASLLETTFPGCSARHKR
jgi:hypothetical protein